MTASPTARRVEMASTIGHNLAIAENATRSLAIVQMRSDLIDRFIASRCATTAFHCATTALRCATTAFRCASTAFRCVQSWPASVFLNTE